MSGLNLTEEDIADSHSILDRGRTYYRAGKVKFMQAEGDKITAKIKGNYGTYTIKISVDEEDDLDYSCTCPYDGTGCKHIVAVLYQWLHEQQGKKTGIIAENKHAHKHPPAVKWNLSLNDIVQQVLERKIPSGNNCFYSRERISEFPHENNSRLNDAAPNLQPSSSHR